MLNDTHEDESLVGRRLFGEYSVIRKLGEGGMGAVYLLQQDSIDQKIAVKVLHGRAVQQNEMVKRFNREAKAVSMLNHPNITRLFIFGRSEDGLIYLAMEYVKGESLRETFERGAIDEMRAITIMKQVLSALAEAHHMGIVHRDLKPDNIMLTDYRGRPDFVKVLDFGIAKVKEPVGGAKQQKLTQAGVVYGTPEYLSPEQAQALELDHRTDLYSLGVILYEMLTGRVPFSAPTAVTVLTMHVFEEPRPPREINPNCSKQMEQIILKAMAKKPEKRFATADEFLEALVEREAELVRSGAHVSEVRLPGSDLSRSQMLPRIDANTPRPGAPVLAKTQVLSAAAVPDAPSPVQRSRLRVEPSVSAASEEDRKAQLLRKLLMGLIIFSTLLLAALVVVIFFVWKMKNP